mgnify:FL=1
MNAARDGADGTDDGGALKLAIELCEIDQCDIELRLIDLKSNQLERVSLVVVVAKVLDRPQDCRRATGRGTVLVAGIVASANAIDALGCLLDDVALGAVTLVIVPAAVIQQQEEEEEQPQRE